MATKEKTTEIVEVQGFNFNLKGTKAMGKVQFIKSFKEQKELAKKKNEGKDKGRLGRFDPEKAWDTLFPKG